ncbi:MAG: ATP-binding protein [Burkholderiales bacterium]
MGAAFPHGIRFRLFLASLVLLGIPALAAQFINRMESFLRAAQEQDIAVTARAVASALSDRAALFPPEGAAASDPEDEERRRIVGLFAAADPEAAASLGTAYAPSEEIERFLDIMGRRASRLWVVDTRSRVRGLSGSLRDPRAQRPDAPQPMAAWLKPVVSLVVTSPEIPAGDESKPVRAQIDRALIGVSSTYWRGTRDREAAILSAAQPVFVGDDIVGAVVVEETTAAILLLRQSALENLIALTLAVCVAAFAILLFFASRLATRIRRLHAGAEAAIDAQGRIRGAVVPSGAKDEIGDLERTVAGMLGRLRDYNTYLEQMAGRLSHELRTPVAVVRSSLDNLRSQPLAGEARVYLDRAGEGVERLSRLISRLSEGTRLEKMLESAERERFDLAAVVRGCVEGYRGAYPGREFDCEVPAAPVEIEGVPDALAQVLDKLVENALDFAPPGSAIRIRLAGDARHARLSVANEGPPIPPAMLPRLFDAMVSARDEGQGRGGHLGLGLAIVRLVAGFHGGAARAANLPDGRGVHFEVELPVAGPRHAG